MPIAGSAHWVKASHGELDPQLLKRRGEGRFAKLTSEVRLDAKERKGSNDVLASRVSRDHASLWEERGGEVTVAFGLDRIDRNDRVGNSWTDPIGLARQKKAVSSPIAEMEVDGADEIDGLGPWGSSQFNLETRLLKFRIRLDDHAVFMGAHVVGSEFYARLSVLEEAGPAFRMNADEVDRHGGRRHRVKGTDSVG